MEKFSYEANGYNRKEVNQFISDVIVQTEGIITRCKSQSAEIEKLRADLELVTQKIAVIDESIRE